MSARRSVLAAVCGVTMACVGPENSWFELAPDTETVLVAVVDPEAKNPLEGGVLYVSDRDVPDLAIERPPGYEVWFLEYARAANTLQLVEDQIVESYDGFDECGFRTLPPAAAYNGGSEAPGWFARVRLPELDVSQCYEGNLTLLRSDETGVPQWCCQPGTGQCDEPSGPIGPLPVTVEVDPPCIGDGRCGEAQFVPNDCNEPSDARLGVCESDLSTCPAGRWPPDLPTSDVAYVDASAAAGGDGTIDRPYQDLRSALADATKSTVALAAGRYEQTAVVQREVRIVGHCAGDTIVGHDGIGTDAFTLAVIGGWSVQLEELTLVGGATITADGLVEGRPLLVENGANVEAKRLVLEPHELLFGAVVGTCSSLTAEQLSIPTGIGGINVGRDGRVRLTESTVGATSSGGIFCNGLPFDKTGLEAHPNDRPGWIDECATIAPPEVVLDRTYVESLENIAVAAESCDIVVDRSLLTSSATIGQTLLSANGDLTIRDSVVRATTPCMGAPPSAVITDDAERAPTRTLTIERSIFEAPRASLYLYDRQGTMTHALGRTTCRGAPALIGVSSELAITDSRFLSTVEWNSGGVLFENVAIDAPTGDGLRLRRASVDVRGMNVRIDDPRATAVAVLWSTVLNAQRLRIDGSGRRGLRFASVPFPLENVLDQVAIHGMERALVVQHGSNRITNATFEGTVDPARTSTIAAIEFLEEVPDTVEPARLELAGFSIRGYGALMFEASTRIRPASLSMSRGFVDQPLPEWAFERNACAAPLLTANEVVFGERTR